MPTGDWASFLLPNLHSVSVVLISCPLSPSVGGCRCHGPQDYCGHVRRLGCPWWWCLLWKGLHQGGPLSSLCCPLGGQVPGKGWALPESAGSGRLPSPALSHPSFLSLPKAPAQPGVRRYQPSGKAFFVIVASLHKLHSLLWLEPWQTREGESTPEDRGMLGRRGRGPVGRRSMGPAASAL